MSKKLTPKQEKFAQNVDLLVHEALAPNLVGTMNEVATNAGIDNLAKITADILDYHASPVGAAETARDATCKIIITCKCIITSKGM